ncbi:DUF748 domain-containing protein [Marinomonas sp. FW-1]|uniref:DUF748 domain-containing protein n=1 Tax=Marinomonas sp. FW-1 TaxID=2071621 RepID=UPI0010C00A13|nr:DUF748 domain-containing protein [Marinomonas sp. FW-1]
MTRRHFRHFVFYPFAGLTGLITLTWLVTPFIAEHFLKNYFQEQNEDLTVGKLSVDFFPPKIDLKNIVINDKTQDTLTLKRAIVEVEIWPLFTKTVHISQAKIDGLNLVVAQQEKDWIVAGINTSQFATPEDQQEPEPDTTAQAEEDTSTPWSIKLPAFSFTDSQVKLSRQPDLNAPAQTDTLTISQLSIEDLSGQALTWEGDIALSALLNDTTLSLDSQFDYSPEQASADLSIQNTRLNLESFRHFMPAPYNEGKGLLELEGNLQFSQQLVNNAPVFDIKDLSLSAQIDNLDLPLNKQDKAITKSTTLALSDTNVHFVSAEQLNLKGTLDLQSTQSSFNQGELQTQFEKLALNVPFDVSRNNADVTAKGKLDMQLDIPAFAQADLNAKLNSVKLSTPFDVTQNELGLTATGDLDLQLGKSLIAQAQQQVEFEGLTLKAPLDIKQDEENGLTANVASTALDLNELALSLDSLAVQNKQLRVALNEVNFSMDSSQAITASLIADIQSNGLTVQQAGNTANYDTFNLTNTLALQKDSDSLIAKNSQLSIDIKGLKATQSDEKHISLGAATLTADQLNVDQAGQASPRIEGINLNFSSDSLDSKLTNNKRIASWKNAGISNLSFTQQDSDFDASLAQLNVMDFTFSELISAQNDKAALPALGHLNSLKVEQLKANQDGADIKNITADALDINLMLDAQQQIENLVFTEAEPQTAPTKNTQKTQVPRPEDAKNALESEQDTGFKPPYYVILGAYDTTGKSRFYFQDKSISPMLKRALDIETLSLRNLDTTNKDQGTTFAFKARNGKYTTLQADATVWPLADKLTLNSDVVVREAELPPFSSYIANILGYQIDSGQLDLDLKLNAKDGVLNGSSNIVLREFDLGGRQESNSVIKAGAVPLNIAVSVLKDSDNNIDLNIPLSGDIENPEFGWTDFLFLPVKKALYTASSTYLMQTFIPYANVISIAQFAGDQLLKIRVEPLIFEAEDEALSDTQDTFLEQLVALMKDKKDSQLKACAITSYLDLGLEKPPVSIDQDTRDEAINLAQKRAENLKDYLVNEGIASSRVYLCSPAIDLSRSSKPRIELNF